jgi:hypothetical protein
MSEQLNLAATTSDAVRRAEQGDRDAIVRKEFSSGFEATNERMR